MTKEVNENESDECTRNNIFCDLLTSLGVDEKPLWMMPAVWNMLLVKRVFWPL